MLVLYKFINKHKSRMGEVMTEDCIGCKHLKVSKKLCKKGYKISVKKTRGITVATTKNKGCFVMGSGIFDW